MTRSLVLLLILQGQEPNPPRSPVISAIQYLLAHQGADGSWGGSPPNCKCQPVPAARIPTPAVPDGDLEATAWVILVLAQAGYTELSRGDAFGGRNVGEAVRLALDWMVSKQDKEGFFDRTDGAANALASLALLETYGMTVRRKDPAERAYACMEKATPKDTIGRIRQGMVIESAKLAEIGTGYDLRLSELAQALEREESATAKAGALLLRGFAWPKGKDKPEVDYASIEPLKVSAETLYVFVSGSCIMDGGDRWHKWFPTLRKLLEPLQRKEEKACESGSWDAQSIRDRVRLTAIYCLTLEHYRCFHCRNVFRKQK